MELTARKEFGIIKIFDENGELTATFSGESADKAMGIFVNGLIHHGGYSLFDESAAQYIVGTVAQLASADVEA